MRQRFDRRGKRLGDAERVGVGDFAFDLHRLRCAAREALAKCELNAIRAEGDHGHIASLGIFETKSFLERKFIVGGDDEFQSRFIDSSISGGDFDARFSVRDLRGADNRVQRRRF